MRRFLAFILLQIVIASQVTAAPAASDAAFCETAISAAERQSALPPRMMNAIALAESGRLDPATGRVRPWPWTINAEGVGQYFATREHAIAAVRALRARGIMSIDVGCMQVNLLFHPTAFTSIEQAFDPAANAAYAARFLTDLFAEHRHWHKAIGAYHSRTPALASAYLDLVLARWQGASLTPAKPSAYQAFARPTQVYGAFADAGKGYAAFATVKR